MTLCTTTTTLPRGTGHPLRKPKFSRVHLHRTRTLISIQEPPQIHIYTKKPTSGQHITIVNPHSIASNPKEYHTRNTTIHKSPPPRCHQCKNHGHPAIRCPTLPPPPLSGGTPSLDPPPRHQGGRYPAPAPTPPAHCPHGPHPPSCKG